MKPNIVVIISDALRAKDLSLYGRSLELDKNIKKIASESIVFENNFSASNASDPSLTSIFSGQYVKTHGFVHQHPFMKEEEIEKLRKNKFWLPIYLQNLGYETIAITPMHLWFKKGFDFCVDISSKGGNKFLDTPLVKRILLSLPNWAYSLGKRLSKARASPQFYPCSKIIDSTIGKIKHAKNPFFLFMHLVDTHYPYAIAKNKYKQGPSSVKKIIESLNVPSQKEYIKKRFFDISANSMEEIESKRDEAIWRVDREIGRLYSFLKKFNIWKNTIFILLSDHGDNFGEHSTYFCRGGLYDESVHVPLIMHLPKIKSKRIKELTQSIDIAPTLINILEGKNKKLDGKSLIPLIKTGKRLRNIIISNDGFCEKRNMAMTKSRKLIISDGSKCHLCGAAHGERREEYDLVKDPEELNNIYSRKNKLERFLKSQ